MAKNSNLPKNAKQSIVGAVTSYLFLSCSCCFSNVSGRAVRTATERVGMTRRRRLLEPSLANFHPSKAWWKTGQRGSKGQKCRLTQSRLFYPEPWGVVRALPRSELLNPDSGCLATVCHPNRGDGEQMRRLVPAKKSASRVLFPP